MNPRPLAVAALALLLPGLALAQFYVVPRRPGKSPVNSYKFEWQHVDILVGPNATGMAKAPEHTAHDKPPGAQGGANPDAPTTSPETGDPKHPTGGNVTPETVQPGTNPSASSEATPPPLVASEAADGGVPGTQDGGTMLSAAGVDGGSADGGGVASLGLGLGNPDGGFNYTYAKTLGDKTGGVRFYFYERERMVAERAAPVIEGAYRYLVDTFHYVPTQTFPYILYSSYQEFLQTNLFQVSEGTLGITSTGEDLKLTLPYLGDHRLFEEISTHELSHQFTIQKVRTVAEQAKVFGDPLAGMPLWFIEGLAEFYAKRGMDPEAEMLVRDLLVNPDLYKGYAFLDFFSPGPYGYLWIYKVGQVRCTFLEEEYGKGFIQRVLEESPRLVGGSRDSPSLKFEELLERLTGDDPKRLAARFENWLKRRAFKTYLSSEQAAPVMDMLDKAPGYITSMASSPDGHVLALRTIVPETGESRLYLMDPRAPERTVRVTSDGAPGVESLHPISGRSFALTENKLAFIAEMVGRDVIYVQDYQHVVEKRAADVLVRRTPIRTGIDREVGTTVRLGVGGRVAYRIDKHGLLAAYSPAFSADGRWLAFIGINDSGLRDLYALDLQAGPDAKPIQLTDDVYSERQLTWGPSGIIFTSDATAHRKYNLFRVKVDAPRQVERITFEERDEADPTALPDGRVFFTAFNNSSSDLHELMKDGSIVRRTDLTTGVFEPGPGPEGSLWMLFHMSGERRPALLRPPRMLALDVPKTEVETESKSAPPEPIAVRPLTDAQAYRPFTRQNLEFGPIFGFAGAGGGGFVGQLFAAASDRMRDHQFLLTLSVYGSFDLTDGYLLYINDENRTTWGGGLFQSLRFRVDQTFKDLPVFFTSGERYFGVMGSLRYPLSTFFYLQGDLSLGGAKYFLDDPVEFYLFFPDRNEANQELLTAWNAQNRDIRFQTEVSGQVGYDTLKYHYATGPLSGSSALLEATVGVQPFDNEAYSNLRLDAERYFPIYGRTNVFIRGGAGTTLGGRYARSYFLSSFDTLRGVNFGDEQWLLGRNFFYSTMELQLPLNDIVRVAFLSDLEAIAAMDFGGVGENWADLRDHRVLDAVVGVNLALGPLLMRLHFARPLDIGAAAGKPDAGWVTNFSLGIAGLNGFFDQGNTGAKNNGAVKPMTPALMPSTGGGYTGPRH
ncbi:PD40 domain-containing protein [Pyxidicoccus parkwayensis]|uniref:PD40 domain-containing protein n=1 Tax=Pyxidicoccus parkwayensis TaxID=2813578 RepID=A0ABX7NMD9_9BACT|nr:PD40 domain-containing protein [Pyxidicoccus parkwaysis]QSQ18697.1 PD40 domain-containing protein [Pyxidicoccus parkwaysis]